MLKMLIVAQFKINVPVQEEKYASTYEGYTIILMSVLSPTILSVASMLLLYITYNIIVKYTIMLMVLDNAIRVLLSPPIQSEASPQMSV